jgi:hypothetical protein
MEQISQVIWLCKTEQRDIVLLPMADRWVQHYTTIVNYIHIYFGESEKTIMKQWYESLFENYAQKYDKECFVQGTLGECDFIEQELNFDKNIRILDVGCGTGRHAIELSILGSIFSNSMPASSLLTVNLMPQ